MAQANAERFSANTTSTPNFHSSISPQLYCAAVADAGAFHPTALTPATLETIDRAVPFASTKTTAIPGILASDVILEAVQWLWENYIPLGKVTIFDGDPGEVFFLPRLAPAACRTRPQGSTNRQFPAISRTWPPQ
jgi:hypothetical protein